MPLVVQVVQVAPAVVGLVGVDLVVPLMVRMDVLLLVVVVEYLILLQQLVQLIGDRRLCLVLLGLLTLFLEQLIRSQIEQIGYLLVAVQVGKGLLVFLQVTLCLVCL